MRLTLASLAIFSCQLAFAQHGHSPAPPMPDAAGILPAQVVVAPRSLVTLSPSSTSKLVWEFPPEIIAKDVGVCPDGKMVFLVSPAAKGTYVIRVASVENGEPKLTKCVLVVDDQPNPPDPPKPPPPIPPEPPKPPVPTDPLEAELLAIYKTDTAANKRETLAKLSALYKVSVGYTLDPSFTTVGDLANAVREASNQLVGVGLQGVRKRVGEELSKTLGTEPAKPFTPDLRDAAGKLFTRLNAICENLPK
jgi:hypothetical protein